MSPPLCSVPPSFKIFQTVSPTLTQSPLLRRTAPAPYFHSLFLIFQISPSRGGNQNLLPLTLKRRVGVRTMIILILDANNSIIYTTDCHIQFNCRHFCVDMIFLLKLEIAWIKIFSRLFPGPIPWLSVTSLTTWKPCSYWLAEIPRSQSKAYGFLWTPLEIPLLV